MTKEQLRAVFSEIEVILAYNKMLLNSLEKRMAAWNSDTKIGDIFLKMVSLRTVLFILNIFVDRFLESVHSIRE